MKHCFLLAVLSACCLAVAAPLPPALRLNHDVAPRRMSLDLTLDPARDSFSGSVTIELNVNTAVDHFWLNATDITIDEAHLQIPAGRKAAKIIPGGNDFVGFEFDAPLATGTATLSIHYTGTVNTRSSSGIFLSRESTDRYLFTQFEPIDARRAFPCFDEPGFKIPWQITLHVPGQDVAVANTGIESETQEANGLKAVRFRETKPLPSYLIAFGVGPLEFVDAGYAGAHRVPVRIVVPRGTSARAHYAASVTAEILTRLENYFGIPYPYDKADQLAIPLSFGGAMENPGLVTYDANIVLAPSGGDATDRQRLYAEVAAHELSHQWFGDMVTMAWWNDVWLNESFATWMSSRLLSDWKPEWETRSEDQDSRLRAITTDMDVSARRIAQPAESKSDIGNAFDRITYEKGGSVLAMFENAIGPDRFQKAVHDYLTSHLFGTARAEDFLAAIGAHSKPEYAHAFATFLNQNGLPRVNVKLQCRSGAAPTLAIEQQRLLPEGSAGSRDAIWGIPFCAAYSYGDGRQQTCELVTAEQAQIQLSGSGCPAWVLANSNEVGYYEAIYPDNLFANLVRNRGQLTLAEQTGLFRDAAALADAGLAPYRRSLQLAGELASDPRHQIASTAITLASIRAEFLPADLRRPYTDYVRQTFGTRARQLGWQHRDGESVEDQLLRPELVPFVASAAGDPELVDTAKRLVNQWLSDRSGLPTDMVRQALKVAAEHGTTELFDRYLTAAKKETDSFLKPSLVAALGYFRDPQLAHRALELVMNGTFDPRIGIRIFRAMSQEPGVGRLPYEFTKAHYDELAARLPSGIGTDYAAQLPSFALPGRCSTAAQEEMKQFFTVRMQSVQGGPRALANAVEEIGLCAAQKSQAEQSIRAFFTQRAQPKS
jgi:alanyl aminopeptidase